MEQEQQSKRRLSIESMESMMRRLSISSMEVAAYECGGRRAYWRRWREDKRRAKTAEPYQAREQAGQGRLFGDES